MIERSLKNTQQVNNSPMRTALKVMHTEDKYVAELVSLKYMEPTKVVRFDSAKFCHGNNFTMKRATFENLDETETYQVKISSIINGKVMKKQIVDVEDYISAEKE